MANLPPLRWQLALTLAWSIMFIIYYTAVFIYSNLSGTKTEESAKTGEIVVDDVYHSEEVFRMNYAEMEKKFKIYVYTPPKGESGESTYYDTTVGKYASEGYFFKNIRESQFLTMDPRQAHLFFIPISLQKLHQKASYRKMARDVRKDIKWIFRKYPYWNRTMGADHFFLTCHEHPDIDIPILMKNTIRVVCSSSYNTDAATYIPHKDVALPSIMQPFSRPASTGNEFHNRTILSYWAGIASSDTRRMLVDLWGTDDELNIQNAQGAGKMKNFYNSKFCVCPAGSTISNSRITMAIHYGCVPVILQDYLDLPFNDILDWAKFSIVLKESDVFRLKGILNAKAGGDYRRMYRNLIKVQKHFQWNANPVKHDVFHMIMYDLWLRRHVRY